MRCTVLYSSPLIVVDIVVLLRSAMSGCACLQIREDPATGVYVEGATEEIVTDKSALLGVMERGARLRVTAATGVHEGSSRSHSVFMYTVTQSNLETESSKRSSLVLVDLAGSEMVRKTGAAGQQLEEAKAINGSLSALGNVINALAEEKKTHIPYRDSKLTRMLQDSLGGNMKTVLIINVSPSTFDLNETISTLRFGSRAKFIKNTPKVNEQNSEELTVQLAKAESAIDLQQTYIDALEAQLAALKDGAACVTPGAGGGSGGDAPASAEGGEIIKSEVLHWFLFSTPVQRVFASDLYNGRVV